MAAEALEKGVVDGFWANALGSETAVRRGVGKIVVDVRRGDGPPDAGRYTFAALSTTDALIARDPERVAAAVRAVVRAQQILKKEPARATEVGRRRFPPAAETAAARPPSRAPAPSSRSAERGRPRARLRPRARDRARSARRSSRARRTCSARRRA